MSKCVLSIGQCGADHGSISSVLRRHFAVEVVAADGLAGARAAIAARRPDLVLVNRKLDVDYGDGLQVISALKLDPTTADLTTMLVSNYPEYQAEAVAAGAVPGFGKAELTRPEVLDKLRPYLA